MQKIIKLLVKRIKDSGTLARHAFSFFCFKSRGLIRAFKDATNYLNVNVKMVATKIFTLLAKQPALSFIGISFIGHLYQAKDIGKCM